MVRGKIEGPLTSQRLPTESWLRVEQSGREVKELKGSIIQHKNEIPTLGGLPDQRRLGRGRKNVKE
jgi:hypothetical protein